MAEAVVASILPTEREEQDELEALVGSLQQPTGDPELDAVASDGMRIMAREEEQLARYKTALEAETNRILMRYTLLMEKHALRRAQAEELVKECARRADFPGKSKSRHVGFGTYGRRQVPERIRIVDDKAALAWAEKEHPEAVVEKKKVTLTLPAANAAKIVLAHLKATGEIPPGFEHTEAHDECYAKPECD